MAWLLSQIIFFSLHRNGKLNLYNAQNIIHILWILFHFWRFGTHWVGLKPPESRCEKHNNHNYCQLSRQLGLTFGCLLHWVHRWRFTLPLIAGLGRTSEHGVQTKKGQCLFMKTKRIRCIGWEIHKKIVSSATFVIINFFCSRSRVSSTARSSAASSN